MGNIDSQSDKLYKEWKLADEKYIKNKTKENGKKLVNADKKYVDYMNNKIMQDRIKNSKTIWGQLLNSIRPKKWKYLYIDGNPDKKR
jgi:hypothetical protein